MKPDDHPMSKFCTPLRHSIIRLLEPLYFSVNSEHLNLVDDGEPEAH